MITSNASHSVMVNTTTPRNAIMYLNSSILPLMTALLGYRRLRCARRDATDSGPGFQSLTRRGTHNLPALCENFDNLRFLALVLAAIVTAASGVSFQHVSSLNACHPATG